MRLGEYLTSKGLVGQRDLEDALKIQRYLKKPIGRILRDCGYIDQTTLNAALERFISPPSVPPVSECYELLRATPFSADLIEFARERGVIPFEEGADAIVLASKTFRDEWLEAAEERWRRKVSFLLCRDAAFEYLKTTVFGADAAPSIVLAEPSTDDDKINKASPYTSLFRDAILSARKMNASDIHIQPTRDGVDIRFRACGDLFTWKDLSIQHRQSFINEVKRLSNLAIGIHGRAQDSRISFKHWMLDLRASLLPSQYGEKIVLRLLDLSREFDLAASGLDKQAVDELRSALNSKNGVLIISGPTGSGKTTTLYALLTSLDRKAKNIITLEDPIEYSIEGLTQVQVSSKLGFSDALRSVLRQDPDVILVGEIRDRETADLCMKAAQTGHLVLSTLHANGAAEVVTRLLSLGTENYVLRSVLRFSAAQRLVRKLCPSCSVLIGEGELRRFEGALSKKGIRIRNTSQIRARNLSGCTNCTLGVIGRVPILEYLDAKEIEKSLKESTAPQCSASLRDAALKLCEKGEIDPNEICEVA